MNNIILISITYLILGLIFMKFIIPKSPFETIFDVSEQGDYAVVFFFFLCWPALAAVLAIIFITTMLGKLVVLIAKSL